MASRAVVCAGALTAPLAAWTQGAPGVEACRDIADTAQRVACYDAAVDNARAAGARGMPAAVAPAPAPVPVPVPVPVPAPSAAAPAPSVAPRAGSLADRWELDPRHSRGTFVARPYKPVYVLPVVVSSGVNRSPSTPNAANVVSSPIALDRTEAKFQLSLKTKIAQGLFGDNGDLWAGYTQSSRWQVYNSELSRPFHETNYEPEAMLVLRTDYSLLGWRGRLLGVGINHQSNGRSQPLSRSWNRVIGMVGVDQGEWSLMLRPWWRIKEDAAADDNPDIEDHIGRGELLLTRQWGAHVMSLQLRHSLRGGDRSRGSVELEWAFPLAGNLRGHVQLFSGYGESLIDYNFRQSRIGAGVSLLEWR